MLLDGYDRQNAVSNRMPLPVDVVADTAYGQSISGETVSLYYWNSGVLTADAGQAAGTVVIAKLAYSGICDALGAMIGNDKDTSLAWTTGTVLPTANRKPCKYNEIENPTNATLEQIAADVTANFATGEWCLDHRNGIIYGKKATTGTSDTAAYKVSTQSTGGGTSIASTVKVSDGTDILDVLVQDAAFGTASKGLGVFGKYQATPTTYTDGDAAPILLDANGRVVLSSDIEIGAVELKNAATDDRALISDANTARANTDHILLVQSIDAAGQVLGRDAANTARTTGTLVNPVQHIGANGSPLPSGVAADPVYVKDASAGTDVVAVNATGSAAISTTTAIAAEWKLLQVICHFDSAPVASENFILKLDTTAGVAYDTSLYVINPSLSSATDLVFTPDNEMKFKANDELVVTFTNTNAKTYGLSIYYQLI